MITESFDSLDYRRFLAYDYAIFDPRHLERRFWSALDPIALVPSTLGNGPDNFPQLVCLRSLSEAQKAELLQNFNIWHHDNDRPLFSALLECSIEPAQLASHLKRQSWLRTPGGVMAWLRFFDPAVFQHLCWQWTSGQLAALLGRVVCWTFFIHDRWHVCRPAVRPASSRLRPSAHQWRQLERMELLNNSWDRLRRMSPDMAQEEDVPTRLDAALADAIERECLPSADDQVIFAIQQIIYGESLHRHPRIISLLESARNGVKSYTRSCRDLNDTDCRRLVAEVTQSEGIHA